jgi:hypothetical protein
MAYQPDIAVVFDAVWTAIVTGFRGKLVNLPGPYLNRKTAAAAGEQRCRELGWLDVSSHILSGKRDQGRLSFGGTLAPGLGPGWARWIVIILRSLGYVCQLLQMVSPDDSSE